MLERNDGVAWSLIAAYPEGAGRVVNYLVLVLLLQQILQLVHLLLLSSCAFGKRKGEEVLGKDVALKRLHFQSDEGDEGRGHSEYLLVLVDGEVAVAGRDLDAEGDDGGHAGLHGVVVLRPTLHLDQVAALVGHEEGLVLVGGREEVLDALLQLLGEQQLQGTVEDLVPLIAEERGAAGVDVDDGAVVELVDADEHDGAAAVGPVLQHDLLLEAVLVLDCLVDLVVHVLVVLNGLQVVHVEAGDLLAVGDLADVVIALLHLLADLNPVGSHFVQLLEVGVVLVEDAPELKVDQCSFLEFSEDQILLTFHSQLTDEVKEVFVRLFAHLLMDLLLHIAVSVVLVIRQLLILYEQQVLQSQLFLFEFVEKDGVLQLQFCADGRQLISIAVDLLDDIFSSQYLLVFLLELSAFEQLLLRVNELTAGGTSGIIALLAVHFHIAVDVDFEDVLVLSTQVVPEGVGVPDHHFRGGPLVDVLQLELERVGLHLHESSHQEGGEEEEQQETQVLVGEEDDVDHQQCQQVSPQEAQFNQLHLLSDLLVLQPKQHQQQCAGQIQYHQLRNVKQEKGKRFVQDEVGDDSNRHEGGPLDPPELLLVGDKVEIEESLCQDQGCEHAEGDDGERLDVDVVIGVALPESERMAAVIHANSKQEYLRTMLKRGKRSRLRLTMKTNFLMLRPRLLSFLSAMKKKSSTIQQRFMQAMLSMNASWQVSLLVKLRQQLTSTKEKMGWLYPSQSIVKQSMENLRICRQGMNSKTTSMACSGIKLTSTLVWKSGSSWQRRFYYQAAYCYYFYCICLSISKIINRRLFIRKLPILMGLQDKETTAKSSMV